MAVGSIQQGILNRLTRPIEAPRVDTGAFGRYARYYTQQAGRLADALGEGDITTDQWLLAMEDQIAKLHTTAYTIGVGGIDNLTANDLQIIQSIIDKQDGFLTAWANDLRVQVERHMGTLLPADVQKVKNRANLYLNAANATLQRSTAEAMGIPELPAYPGDGSTQCLTSDKCSWKFKKVAGGWDCTWGLHPAEHCPTCLARSHAWNPLRVRNGVIENPGGPELFFTR